MPAHKSKTASNNGEVIAHAPQRYAVSKSKKNRSDDFDPEHLDERELLRVLTEVRNGNFSVRMPIDKVGLSGKICDIVNEIISLNDRMMLGITKAGNTIGKQ